MEDCFSSDGQGGGEEWFQDDSSALRLGFTLLGNLILPLI